MALMSIAPSLARKFRGARKAGSLKCQRAPNPPEFAQPGLSRTNGGHPQREGTNFGAFVLIWLILPTCSVCEATNLGVFDLCHFSPLKRGCANSGGFGAR